MSRPAHLPPPRTRRCLLTLFALTALAAHTLVTACGGASAGPCMVNGQAHDVGDTFAARSCASCTCQPDGSVVCDETTCTETCRYAGHGYAVGASFPSRDGCNTCTCASGGAVDCTRKECACDPKKEWYRNYVGDAEACTRIRYVCPPSTEYFTSPCGCGCEQSSDCPRSCAPGQPCDTSATRARCPYMEVKP